MFSYFEKIIRIIYREWKSADHLINNEHPTEEALVCFLEDKLVQVDRDLIQGHLLSCDMCAEYLSIQLKIEPHLSKEVPAPLLEKVRRLVGGDVNQNLFEIFLRLKENAWEIIQTSGDVLVGQELIPAPVLRSRQIKKFKEEVSILKDLQEVRVLTKVENKSGRVFNLTITIKDKQDRKVSKDLRITLKKDEIELESYISDSGGSVFENIQPGSYRVEVTQETRLLAVIDLKVKA
ncbi:MAG: hypothetical protein KJ710_02100 [Candidatus Omnitrophica bacterium]|nr:hypothetical protein [Candidatus Omnitrophota bacterium]MBU1923042.1 hypothetical protein [Candidatus Omnitrophota bacterium]